MPFITSSLSLKPRKESLTKSVCLADSQASLDAFLAKLHSRKLAPASHSKMLGVGSSGGKRRSVKTVKKRLKGFAAKAMRTQSLKKAGVHTRLGVQAIGAPSYFYGVACYGVADGMLQTARKADTRARRRQRRHVGRRRLHCRRRRRCHQ